MVIKIEVEEDKPPVQAPVHEYKFKLKDIEQMFIEAKDNWKAFYKKNQNELRETSDIDIYHWCVFPLMYKEGPFYRCLLHPSVEVETGTSKKMNLKFENIHYAEFISHCVFYRPEEHKQYIIEKLLKKSNV